MKLRTLSYVSILALAVGVFGYLSATQAGDTTTTAKPAPNAAERAGATVGNEVDKAIGAKTPVTEAEMTQAVSLSTINNPGKALSTAQIKNPAGEAVGTVSSVDVTAKGKAKAINANVGGFLGIADHVVALDASKLVYLKDRNLLVTRLSKDEIQALPTQPAPSGKL